MVEFRKYIDAIIDDKKEYPLAGFAYDSIGDVSEKTIDNNQIITLFFTGDNVNNKRRVIIFKYNYVNGKQTRFVIKLGESVVSIHKQDNEYGDIEIWETDSSLSHANVLLNVGFCDNQFSIGKFKEREEEIKKANSIECAYDVIAPADWNLDNILDEMLNVVKNAHESVKWKKDSEMLFNFLRPALALAVMDTREKWEAYNLNMENYYRGKIDSCIMDQKAEESYNFYKSTREALEAQRKSGESRKK